MILLAREIAGGEEPVLPLLDVTVRAQRVRPPARLVRGRPRRARSSATAASTASSSGPRSSSGSVPTWTSSPASTTAVIVAVRQRNVIATAFHPELAGETRFHRLVADDGRRARRSRRGRRAPAAPDPPDRRDGTRERPPGQGPRGPPDRPRRPRRAVAAGPDRDAPRPARWACRSAARRIGVFSLFRLPLGAFRPHDLLYVYEEDGRLAGLLRVERETPRDEWTIVELDAIGLAEAGDIRFRLAPAHPARRREARGDPLPRRLRRRGRQRRAVHAGRLRPLRRGAGPVPAARRPPCPRPWSDERAAEHGIRPAAADRRRRPGPAVRGGHAPARSSASRRSGSPTGSARAPAGGSRAPASTPILRFADVEAFVRRRPGGGPDGTQLDGFLQVGVAKEDQPHYLKILARPGGGRGRAGGVRSRA